MAIQYIFKAALVQIWTQIPMYKYHLKVSYCKLLILHVAIFVKDLKIVLNIMILKSKFNRVLLHHYC